MIAGSAHNNLKRTLLLAAFDVSPCFARRIIELTKNVPGLKPNISSPGVWSVSGFSIGYTLHEHIHTGTRVFPHSLYPHGRSILA